MTTHVQTISPSTWQEEWAWQNLAIVSLTQTFPWRRNSNITELIEWSHYFRDIRTNSSLRHITVRALRALTSLTSNGTSHQPCLWTRSPISAPLGTACWGRQGWHWDHTGSQLSIPEEADSSHCFWAITYLVHAIWVAHFRINVEFHWLLSLEEMGKYDIATE